MKPRLPRIRWIKKIYKVQFSTNPILKNKIKKKIVSKKEFKTKQLAIKIMMIKFGKKKQSTTPFLFFGESQTQNQ
jgi:hypothetical protein